MIKLCKKCQEEKINKYCPSGYYFGWKEELTHCPHCGCEFVNIDFPAEDLSIIKSISEDVSFIEAMIKLRKNDIVEYQLKMSQFRTQVEQQNSIQRQNDTTPKCPTCGSTNIRKISLTKKAFGGAMFGLFSSDIRNSMHCKNCGAKW